MFNFFSTSQLCASLCWAFTFLDLYQSLLNDFFFF